MVKYSIVAHNLQVLDLCVFRTGTLCVAATAWALLTHQSFEVAKEYRNAMAMRAILGTVAFTCFVFGL